MARPGLHVAGSLRLPGDKSISHRALVFAALARGRSRVRGILESADVRATAASLRALGWPVPPLAGTMEIEGGGLHAGPAVLPAELPCDNSGTTARLLSGVVAAQPHASVLDGDASLRRRPMRRVSEPLEAMGARVTWLGPEGRLPMRIDGGALHRIAWRPDVPSAQVKSAILLAGLCAGVPVSVDEPLATRDHTERMLRSAGARVTSEGTLVRLEPTETLDPVDLTVPADPSSAAFFAALAAGAGSGAIVLEGVLLNPHRTGFVPVLERMGARCEVLARRDVGGESVGDLQVHASPLTGTVIAPAEVPSLIDEIPVLAALAAVAEGETTVRGAAELRVKESDRIAMVVANLRACGVHAEELPDGLVVQGGGTVREAAITTGGDHRIAMAFGVLGALAGQALRIDDPGCVDVSFPTFWSDLGRLTR